MEWSNEDALTLIDYYEKYPKLWNPKDPHYYNKLKKHDAWTEISNSMGKPIHEIKKKMESLLGSYRRERSKVKKSIKTGNAAEDVYVPTWFAYKRMSFLQDRDEPRSRINSETQDSASIAEQLYEENSQFERDPDVPPSGSPATENNDGPPTDGNGEQVAAQSNVQGAVQVGSTSAGASRPTQTSTTAVTVCRSKRPRTEKPTPKEDDPVIKACCKIISDSTTRDECDEFGAYVAGKLRKFCPRTRAIAEHEITSVLLQSELGRLSQPLQVYSYPYSPSSPSPRLLTPSPSHSYTSTTPPPPPPPPPTTAPQPGTGRLLPGGTYNLNRTFQLSQGVSAVPSSTQSTYSDSQRLSPANNSQELTGEDSQESQSLLQTTETYMNMFSSG